MTRRDDRVNVDDVRRAATDRWPRMLMSLGIDATFLRNKNGPCPGCGGKDRFRFDNRDGRGTFVCGRGGDPLAGDGFALVMHAFDLSFLEAVRRVAEVLGIRNGDPSPSCRMTASEAHARLEVLRASNVEAEKAKHAKARDRAGAIWTSAERGHATEYTTRKGIAPHSARFHRGLLVVPLFDSMGVLHSLEFIANDGAKKFLKGGRLRGCYCPIGSPGNVVCVAEGFATAASIHEATGYATACAFSAGNLWPVADALRRKFPAVRLAICADNDRFTPGNPGVKKAREAARAVGAMVAVPNFREEHTGSDWNDYAQHYGRNALRSALAPLATAGKAAA